MMFCLVAVAPTNCTVRVVPTCCVAGVALIGWTAGLVPTVCVAVAGRRAARAAAQPNERDFAAPVESVSVPLGPPQCRPDCGSYGFATASRSVTPRPGVGIVRINAFIPAAISCAGGFCGTGDGRSFDPNAGPEESKFSLSINFETGEVNVSFKYSCLISGYFGIQGANGPPIRPTINGTITLTFNDAGDVGATKSGNLYPAYEVYQDRGFGTEKIATFDEITVDYLIGGPTGSVFRAGQSVAGNARDILTGRWVYG